MFSEKSIEETILYDGPIFRVEHHRVELEDKSRSFRDIVRHSGGVCVAAIDGDTVYLVEQYRIAVERMTLELPAGKLEREDSPLSGAIRELKEETGFEAREIISLGTCLPSPGYTSEVLHMYLALDLIPGEQALDPGEFLNLKKMKLEDVMGQIMSGQIQDAKTMICLFKARDYLEQRRK